jgi:hypothetical protein
MPETAQLSPFQLVRALLVLAVFGFFAGFGGYLVFGPPNAAGLVDSPAQPVAATASEAAPASLPVSDDWNFPKKI